jgi:hypothetical protein
VFNNITFDALKHKNHIIIMKVLGRKFVYGAAILASFISFSCKQNDQIVDKNVTPDPVIPTPSVNELFTYYGSPTDGTNPQTLDAMWANAEKLNVTATVPNPAPPKLFQGYWGNSYNVDLRSICDTINGDIYFLVEWADATRGMVQAPYYFNPTTHAWAKESSSPVFDTLNGVMTRKGMNEDKFSFLWNISCEKFVTQSCYGSCHTYYKDASINSGTGNHWTANYLEKIDQWHLFMMRGDYYHQCSDEFQDDGYSGTGYTPSLTNGRHVDEIGTTPSTKGPYNNQQSLKASNKPSMSQTVPLWINLNPTGDQKYYILDKDTVNTTNFKVIVSVDSMGVLSYSSVRGGAVEGTIDPNVGTDYLQGANSQIAPKAFPSIIVAPYEGGRADIGAYYYHDGSKWHLIFKRKLKTADTKNQDIDFSDRSSDKLFGIGIFNDANNQHAICPGLVLKYKKSTN